MTKRVWTSEEWWHAMLMDEDPPLPGRQIRHLMRVLPGSPRCKFCNAPRHGAFTSLLKIVGMGPARLTPMFCQRCENYANQYLGGTEIELTLLFADVRGSTPLAEKLGPVEFSGLISRFFGVASDVLVRHQAMIDKLVGDQASGLFVPGFAGPDHRQVALQAARDLMRATGHDSPEGPWIPMGVGVHTGVSFVGSVGSKDGVTDITALGDTANVAARLSSAAAAGEILVTEAAAGAALEGEHLERRELSLKGKSQPVGVYVWKGAAWQSRPA